MQRLLYNYNLINIKYIRLWIKKKYKYNQYLIESGKSVEKIVKFKSNEYQLIKFTILQIKNIIKIKNSSLKR